MNDYNECVAGQLGAREPSLAVVGLLLEMFAHLRSLHN